MYSPSSNHRTNAEDVFNSTLAVLASRDSLLGPLYITPHHPSHNPHQSSNVFLLCTAGKEASNIPLSLGQKLHQEDSDLGYKTRIPIAPSQTVWGVGRKISWQKLTTGWKLTARRELTTRTVGCWGREFHCTSKKGLKSCLRQKLKGLLPKLFEKVGRK